MESSNQVINVMYVNELHNLYFIAIRNYVSIRIISLRLEIDINQCTREQQYLIGCV